MYTFNVFTDFDCGGVITLNEKQIEQIKVLETQLQETKQTLEDECNR